jgi:hypothetical protein
MELDQRLYNVVEKTTKKWARQRKAEEKGTKTRASRQYIYSDRVNFTEVANDILPGAYKHASGNGQYTVSKRTLFYACRKQFLERTDRELEFGYFAGNLLVKYMNTHPETAAWKVTADARGHLSVFNSGHDKHIPVSTIDIDNHLRKEHSRTKWDDIDADLEIEWPSLAHRQRYQGVLYIEKEGFDPILEEARIGERFDLAIMSCKGQSVVAARKFVDAVCTHAGVPLLVAHDMDKPGFEIFTSLTKVSEAARLARRITYEFQNHINVYDLGLRLTDAQHYGLTGEPAPFRGDFGNDSICTAEEKEFLRSGMRIELNELTAPQFVEWLETMLKKYLPERMIPSDNLLHDAWRRALSVATLNRAIKRAKRRALDFSETELPENLRKRLRKYLKKHPDGDAWDVVLYKMAWKEVEEAEGKS